MGVNSGNPIKHVVHCHKIMNFGHSTSLFPRWIF